MTKYIVQIDMAEFDQAPLWQDVCGARFDTQEQALADPDLPKKSSCAIIYAYVKQLGAELEHI